MTGFGFVVCNSARCTFGTVPDMETIGRVMAEAFDSGQCARAHDSSGNTVGESSRPCSLHGGTGCPLYGGGISALS